MKCLVKLPTKRGHSHHETLGNLSKRSKNLSMMSIILAVGVSLAACSGQLPTDPRVSSSQSSSSANGRTVRGATTWVGTLVKNGTTTPSMTNYADLTGAKIFFSCEEYTNGSSFSRVWMELNGKLVKEYDETTDSPQQDCATNLNIKLENIRARSEFANSSFEFNVASSNKYLTIGTTFAGLRVASALAQLSPETQASAVRQVSGLSLTNDMLSGFRMTEAGGQGVTQRLSALSSHLAITNGEQAIARAAMYGDPSRASQTSLSLANQSLDAGVAGMWVNFANNNGVSGSNLDGTTHHLQAGQDVAVTPDLTVGVAASSSAISLARSGDAPSNLTGSVLSAHLYMAYSPDRVRLTAQAGGQSGSVQNYRAISTQQNDVAYGQTGFTGSNAEMRIGYELGNNVTTSQSPFSLIPSIAVGYRAQTAKSYSERATSDYLALAVPELSHRNLYAAIGLEARSIFRINEIAAMPRLSVGVERNNSRFGQKGVVALAIDPTAQFNTNLGVHNYGTTARYGVGIDMVGSANGVALRADYQGSISANERVNALTLGTKIGF
ncbi:MAG: autotransporter outer membrane beta-barrel domain-containing protein [Alphaproteobacteria bacterium]|nr:autotransporter outer membrane beta-barrel domain-containing protein [Alphaproteobacteria bacterium]